MFSNKRNIDIQEYVDIKLVKIMQTGVASDNKYEVMVKGIRLVEWLISMKTDGKSRQGITAKWKVLSGEFEKGTLAIDKKGAKIFIISRPPEFCP